MADDELVFLEYKVSPDEKLVARLGLLLLLDGATMKTEEIYFEKDEKAVLTLGPGIEKFEATIDALYVSPPETNDFRETLQFVNLEACTALKVISDDCFSDCTALQGVQLPESLECIGNGAFSHCSTLNSITPVELPNLKSIGSFAFNHCEKLKQFTFGPNVLFIGPFAFCGSGLSSLSYAKTCKVRFIGDGAFQETHFSGAVALPSNLIYLGSHAFYQVKNMTSVKFPDSLKVLGEGAFESCAVAYTKKPYDIDLRHTQIRRLYKNVFMGNKIHGVAILPPSLERCNMSAFSSAWVTGVVLPASIFNGDDGFDKLPELERPHEVGTVVAYETPANPFAETHDTTFNTLQFTYGGVHFGVAPTFATLICVRTDPTDGAVMLDQVTPTRESADSWVRNNYPRQFHLGRIETQISSQCLRLRFPVVLQTMDGTHTTLLNDSFDMDMAIDFATAPLQSFNALQNLQSVTLNQIVQEELELKQGEFYIADPRYLDNMYALEEGFRVRDLRGLLKDVKPQNDVWNLIILFREMNPRNPKRAKTSKAFVDLCR